MVLKHKLKIIGYTIPMLFHAIRVTILFQIKADIPNQRALAINLAAADILYCLFGIFVNVLLSFQLKALMDEILYFISFLSPKEKFSNYRSFSFC